MDIETTVGTASRYDGLNKGIHSLGNPDKREEPGFSLSENDRALRAAGLAA
jgi:hypothetical protein